MSTAIVKASAADIERREFGAVQTQQIPETAATAVAARERAATEARYLMAERHPRSIEQFRADILKECERPGFAAVARYRRPVGKTFNKGKSRWEEQYAEGPSIRFIEGAIRAFRNLYPEVVTVFDNEVLRICRATVTDLEANIAYSTEVQVPKAIERRGFLDEKTQKWIPPKGREILGERLNSNGEPTYLVRATDDEVFVKQNALLSRAIRTQAQRLLPADVVEECMATVLKTQANRDAKDPSSARRQIIDAFRSLGVEPNELEQFCQKPLERIQPKDLEELRAVYTAIKDGQATWEEIMEELNPTFGSAEEQEKAGQQKLAALRGDKKQESKDQPKSEPTDGEAETLIAEFEKRKAEALAAPVNTLPTEDDLDGEIPDQMLAAVKRDDGSVELRQWSAANSAWTLLKKIEPEAEKKSPPELVFGKGKK